MYRILIFLTRGGPRCTQPAGTAALNSACPSFGRHAVRPLRRDLRGAILSPLRHTGLDDVPAVGGPGKSGRLAVPPVWNLVGRELLPELRLPRGAWAPRPAPPSTARPILTILWTLAIAGFVLFAVTDFAGLAVSPSLLVPNIQGLRSGQTVNSGMDFNGNWSFDSWGTASSPSYQGSGGNPGGFIEMTLFGTGARGYFWQAFDVSGSRPYTGAVRLDLRIAGGLTSGRLLVSVDGSPVLD